MDLMSFNYSDFTNQLFRIREQLICQLIPLGELPKLIRGCT